MRIVDYATIIIREKSKIKWKAKKNAEKTEVLEQTKQSKLAILANQELSTYSALLKGEKP